MSLTTTNPRTAPILTSPKTPLLSVSSYFYHDQITSSQIHPSLSNLINLPLFFSSSNTSLLQFFAFESCSTFGLLKIQFEGNAPLMIINVAENEIIWTNRNNIIYYKQFSFKGSFTIDSENNTLGYRLEDGILYENTPEGSLDYTAPVSAWKEGKQIPLSVENYQFNPDKDCPTPECCGWYRIQFFKKIPIIYIQMIKGNVQLDSPANIACYPKDIYEGKIKIDFSKKTFNLSNGTVYEYNENNYPNYAKPKSHWLDNKQTSAH